MSRTTATPRLILLALALLLALSPLAEARREAPPSREAVYLGIAGLG